MTNEDLVDNWQKYALEVDHKRHFNLKDRYMLCWGYIEAYGGVAFDVGGPQGGELNVFTVDDTGTLISINPANPSERKPIGVLVPVEL